MQLGADPLDLERLAATHEACAGLLARVRTRLRATDRHAWRGPTASRWWSMVDSSLVPALVAAGSASSRAARQLGLHAREQRRASLAEPSTSTLLLDRTGDGRWVGRTGSRSAEVVVVIVPGVGVDLSDVDRLRADGERLWSYLAAAAEQRLGAPGAAAADRPGPGQTSRSAHDRVSVVSWLGYDPPDRVVLGVDRRPAARGAEALRREVQALRSGGVRRVVVVGHSYGAVVAARASAAGMVADELVMLGAPGLGVPGPASLRLAPGADVWSVTAPSDPIALVARSGILHGPDPARSALTLPTAARGHSGYLHDPLLLDALAALALDDLAEEPFGHVAGRSGDPVPSIH